jgi:formate dehydrogenase maturation protein FdhE
MTKPSIREQILDVESVQNIFPEYSNILHIYHKTLLILLSLYESKQKGAKITLNNKDIEKKLEKTIKSREPIIDSLTKEDFNSNDILDAVKKIVKLLIDENAEGGDLRHLKEDIENGELAINEAIDSVLKADAHWFNIQSKKYGIEPALLLFIFDSPLKPFFEYIAQNVEDKIKETWLEPYCPVCGRQPIIAKKRKMKHYMVCVYCGIEYLFDMFRCINCGNNDPTFMGFIKVNEHDNYELNYCEICNHYIKVIEESLIIKIPSGLEDLLTRKLDNIATTDEFNFKRS